MTALGGIYLGQQDVAQGRSWVEKAAELGEPAGMFALGLFYFSGKGGPQDYDRARGWFEKAAEKGRPEAMNFLGRIYQDGLGVGKDFVRAESLYEQAATRILANARAAEMGWQILLSGEMSGWWTEGTMKALQERLKASGDYQGQVDGKWGDTEFGLPQRPITCANLSRVASGCYHLTLELVHSARAEPRQPGRLCPGGGRRWSSASSWGQGLPHGAR